MLGLSYYCLCLLFKKIGEKGRTCFAWKCAGVREIRRGLGAGGRNGSNNVWTCE
jgi:hypothetical protein